MTLAFACLAALEDERSPWAARLPNSGAQLTGFFLAGEGSFHTCHFKPVLYMTSEVSPREGTRSP